MTLWGQIQGTRCPLQTQPTSECTEQIHFLKPSFLLELLVRYRGHLLGYHASCPAQRLVNFHISELEMSSQIIWAGPNTKPQWFVSQINSTFLTPLAINVEDSCKNPRQWEFSTIANNMGKNHWSSLLPKDERGVAIIINTNTANKQIFFLVFINMFCGFFYQIKVNCSLRDVEK